MNTDLPTDPAAAIALQRQLAARVVRDHQCEPPRLVAGVDVAFPGGGAVTRAAVVVVDQTLKVIDWQLAQRPTRMPYIPGLLSFRELPPVLDALHALKTAPDLLLVDGQGVAHPRRLGIASHLGVVTGLPAIGVGKSRLCGRHADPGMLRGNMADLVDRGELIGRVLRTRSGVRPVYVSTGHRVGLDQACAWVLAYAPRFRLPEPVRLADFMSRHGRLPATAC